MSSSIHLQRVVVQFSLTRLCKVLTVHQRLGDVSADAHPSVAFELFGTNPSSRGISYQARYSCSAKNRLRLNDVTLSMSSLLVLLCDLSAWFSVFNTAHLTNLRSKTGYRRLTNLKMSNNLLIHHAGSWHSDHNFTLTLRRVRVASHHENFQILLRFICFGTCTNQSMRTSMTWGARGM